MAQDALIRVRLDTKGARQDLQALYGDMRRAPTIPGPGMGAGAGGAAGGGGGGGAGAAGGFNLTRLLSRIAAGAGIAALGRDALSTGLGQAGALTGGISSRIEEALFGNLGPQLRGRQRAMSETAGQLGLARGLGLVSGDTAQSLYEALRPLREAEETGKTEIERQFKGEIAGKTAEGLLGRIADVLDAIKTGLDNLRIG